MSNIYCFVRFVSGFDSATATTTASWANTPECIPFATSSSVLNSLDANPMSAAFAPSFPSPKTLLYPSLEPV